MIYPSNKLYRIKQKIKEWESSCNSNRQFEVKLSRLRKSDFRMTHEYLMKREQPLICQYCPKRSMVVEHCLIGCSRWTVEK